MIALVLAVVAADPSVADAVKARLADAPAVVGRFEQQKQVKGFKKPLASSGDFVVAKGQGIRWRTEKPFPSELVVRPTEIVSKQGDTEVFHLDATKEPAVRVVNTVLFALLAGDVDVLARHFEVAGQVTAEGWSLSLTPKPGGLGKVLAKIQLSGDRFVQRIELTEASGDVTRIRVVEPREESHGW